MNRHKRFLLLLGVILVGSGVALGAARAMTKSTPPPVVKQVEDTKAPAPKPAEPVVEAPAPATQPTVSGQDNTDTLLNKNDVDTDLEGSF